MHFNRQRRLLMAGATMGVLAPIAAYVAAKPQERVIKVVAKKFDYTPSEIRVKKGEPVVLELTTLDVVMGFSAPDFQVRENIVPGMVAKVRLIPDKVGTFTFFCDIFCGSGHENMNGSIMWRGEQHSPGPWIWWKRVQQTIQLWCEVSEAHQ
jgi:cytochrome c oxidase subunit II